VVVETNPPFRLQFVKDDVFKRMGKVDFDFSEVIRVGGHVLLFTILFTKFHTKKSNEESSRRRRRRRRCLNVGSCSRNATRRTEARGGCGEMWHIVLVS